jgi:hypothetical protein
MFKTVSKAESSQKGKTRLQETSFGEIRVYMLGP